MTFTTSNTGRCRTCKWWDGGWNASRLEADHPLHNWGLCKAFHSNHGRPKHQSHMALAIDSECYHAALHTLPDFGCVQWERRHEEADAVKEQGGSA